MITISQAISELHLEQVRQLRRDYLAFQKQTYFDELDLLEKYFDSQVFEEELASLPGKFAPPTGRLLIAHDDGAPAGMVGLRQFKDRICEMKSMFVSPSHMGKGIGRTLAETLIEEALAIGYTKMRLDTGPRQVAAQNLYRSLGFREIEPYYNLPPEFAEKALFMELDL
jgi:ribosomal protein S18 acetylase RimI-like enzyme